MQNLAPYNIVWDSQSKHAGESMPVGGHDIGLNVWVENGEIVFYIDRTGSFDENNQMLKLGRIRLRLQPNPFGPGTTFRQELKLLEGYAEITGTTPDGIVATVRLWVEIFRPIIHLEVDSSRALQAQLQYETWRTAERALPADRRMASLSAEGYPGPVTTKPDQVQFDGEAVLFYHRNRSDALIFDKVVDQQGLAPYKEHLWNPQVNLTFGGLVRAPA